MSTTKQSQSEMLLCCYLPNYALISVCQKSRLVVSGEKGLDTCTVHLELETDTNLRLTTLVGGWGG